MGLGYFGAMDSSARRGNKNRLEQAKEEAAVQQASMSSSSSSGKKNRLQQAREEQQQRELAGDSSV